MEIQLPPHLEQSILAAFNAGEFDDMAIQIVEAARASKLTIKGTALREMPENHNIEDLLTAPVFDAAKKPAPHLWPQDEDIEEFLAFVRLHRNDAPAIDQ